MISHSEHCLPELEIQSGFRKFARFFKLARSTSRYSILNFSFTSIRTKEYTITVNTMHFTTEVEDEDVWGVVSHRLYRTLLNPPNKVWRVSTQSKTTNSHFQIGDSITYTNEDHNDMVDLVDTNSNEPTIM